MRRAKLGFCAAAMLCVAFLPSVAHAKECRLEEVASLDMTRSPEGLLVSVSVEGKPKTMIVDTGSPASSLDPRATVELGLATLRIVQGTMFDSDGRQFTSMAVIHDLTIGNMHASNARFFVLPASISDDPKVAGLLGADLLRHYDIELDFAKNKLNLFNQNHCEGQVVYWPANGVAVVPMHVVNSGHIIVPVSLDGHPFDAVFDTGASGTFLSLNAAHNIFGLKPGTTELPLVADTESDPYYVHTFKTLSLEGVAIGNPKIYIRQDKAHYAINQVPDTGTRLSDVTESEGVTDIILGMQELQHLHIFISYAEQKIYITAAEPPAKAAEALQTSRSSPP